MLDKRVDGLYEGADVRSGSGGKYLLLLKRWQYGALGGEPTSFLPAWFLCEGQKDTGEDPPAAASVARSSGNAQIINLSDGNFEK